ncbi:MAG: hypothetical protein ACYCT1_04100 [Steroidobacteraceae bacterium]
MAADSCVDAPREALARFALIEISGMGQGVQFISTDCITNLMARQVGLRADDRGRSCYTGVIERLSQSVGCERICVHA